MRRADSFEKTLILGKIEGGRRKGWQRMRCLDGIIDSLDMTWSKLLELVMDREAWHAAFQDVTKSWTWLSGWTELVLTVLADISKWLWFAFLWGLEIHFNFGGTYICFVWTIYSVCLISFKSDYFTINCMSFFFLIKFYWSMESQEWQSLVGCGLWGRTE